MCIRVTSFSTSSAFISIKEVDSCGGEAKADDPGILVACVAVVVNRRKRKGMACLLDVKKKIIFDSIIPSSFTRE